jgi:hypothetical protein
MATSLRKCVSDTAPRASKLVAPLIAALISGTVVWDVLTSTAFAQDDITGSSTRGAAGWNGGSRDVRPTPGTPQDPQRGAAPDDPLYATGIDLKGPAVRYGPDRAPE